MSRKLEAAVEEETTERVLSENEPLPTKPPLT